MNNFKRILMVSLVILIAVFIFVVFFLSKNFRKNLKEEEILLNDNRPAIDMSTWVPAKDLRPIDKNDYFWGSSKAKLDVIVYEDLSDFYSSQFNETINLIKENFSDKVRIAFRPFISKSFPNSGPSYLLAKCAGEQDKFFEMRELILTKVSEENFSETDFSTYISDLKLDENKANQCLYSKKYAKEIEAYSKESENFGVYGSPTIFVGEEIVPGARKFNDMVSSDGENLLGMENIINKNLSSSNLLSQGNK